MIFQIDPTAAETQRACSAMAAAGLPPSRANAITFTVYMAVAVLAGLLVPKGAVTAVLLTVGGVVIAVYWLHVDGRRRIRRAREADPHTNETHQLEVSEAGLHSWCAHVDARYTWDGLTQIVDTPEFYLFMRGPGGGPALPKRLLTPTTDTELRGHLREWAPHLTVGLATASGSAGSGGSAA